MRETALTAQHSSMITISKFEYEYLTNHAASVEEIVDKKVAAAEAWIEALKASEKEILMERKIAQRELKESKLEPELEVYTKEKMLSRRAPQKHQKYVSYVLGLPMSKVVCKTKRVGGGFGGKETRSAFIAVAASVPSYLLNRPVKITLDRDVDMMITGQQHSFLGKYKDTSSTLFVKVRANGSWTSEGQAGGSNSSSDGMESAKEKPVIIPTVLIMVVLIVLLSLLLLLVYEFMKNGSLDKWIFPSYQGRDRLLDWTTRSNIAIAIAQGIAYFHEQCRDRIIHCDIKLQNILVDENFCPKVSNFGLAKLIRREHSHVVTMVRGAKGYLAPQWVSNHPIIVKADVYNYGMLLLEIIGGRRNLDMSFGAEDFFYPGSAYKEMTNGSIIKVADRR
ncbi:hypothetical protein JHK84_027894 [Glycine max]|nr:hypothetical protein JHK84_027894 [Glycine max]